MYMVGFPYCERRIDINLHQVKKKRPLLTQSKIEHQECQNDTMDTFSVPVVTFGFISDSLCI
jgi:hypothetical protein